MPKLKGPPLRIDKDADPDVIKRTALKKCVIDPTLELAFVERQGRNRSCDTPLKVRMVNGGWQFAALKLNDLTGSFAPNEGREPQSLSVETAPIFAREALIADVLLPVSAMT